MYISRRSRNRMMYNHGSVCPVKLLHHNHRIFIEFHREREAELELWKDIPAESGERGTPERVPCAAPSRACAGPRQNRGPESEPEGRRSAGKRGAFERISRTCGLLRHAGACPDIVFLLEKALPLVGQQPVAQGAYRAVRRFVRADHEIKVVGQRIGLVPDAFVRRGDSIAVSYTHLTLPTICSV